jgi:hypothetical protein
LIGLTEVIPYFCCALFAGYAKDHHSRRMFGVLACLMLFLTALTLVAVSIGWIDGNPALWIYGSIAFTEVAHALNGTCTLGNFRGNDDLVHRWWLQPQNWRRNYADWNFINCNEAFSCYCS